MGWVDEPSVKLRYRCNGEEMDVGDWTRKGVTRTSLRLCCEIVWLGMREGMCGYGFHGAAISC